MTRYPFPDNKTTKVLTALLLTGLLVLARDTLYTSSVFGFYRAQFLMLVLIAAAGVTFLIVQRHRLKEIFLDRRMAFLVIATVFILLPMLVKKDWQLMYFSVLLCIWTGAFFSYFSTLEQISRYYVLILCGFGLYSILATYGLRILPDRGLVSVPVIRNSIDVEFYNFGFCFPAITYVKNRNFGIFREPGVYQYFLLLALFLNNETVRWEKSRSMWIANGILAVTMLSTFATGGVIEMGLLAILLFIDKKWYKDKKICISACVLVAAVAVAAVLIVLQKGSLYVELMGMVTKFTSNPESTGGRIGAIVTDMLLFFRHPLFGAGLAEALHSVVDNTTSTMLMFAIFGVFGGILHTAAWVALVWKRERNWLLNLGLLVVMFMSFNTQNLIADVFFWLMPVMALVQRGLPMTEKKR